MIRLPTIAIFLLTTLGVRAADVDFDRDIRPILSENCFFCHGPDANHREADLRLDTEEDALSMITPSDRSASDLYDRLTTDDPDSLMPPPDSNRKLSGKQIELIGQWIDQGATWSKHWAFRGLRSPPIPEVQPMPAAPIRNPIDAFVQLELRKRGMKPSPEADRRTLIRRLSLDLRGLPPKPQEVQQFVADTHPDAYDRLVQRMLDSPAYGQRMAWDWLDAARYADTNGYQGDRERTMWPWRDWVVQAFNENLPYDEFTRWQLAGDLLPSATEQQKLATGFCRNHMINGEGGRIAEENRVEYVMDMTETMGTIWLGLTLNCCRCHDHKYDPITNKEYYQLFSFFNQTPVSGGGGDPQTAPNMPAPSDAQRKRLAELKTKIAEADQRLAGLAASLADKQGDWEKQQIQALSAAKTWVTIRPKTATATVQQLSVLDDQSILAAGDNPNNDTYTITGQTTLTQVTGLRLEALKHESMTAGGLARSDSGNFVLTSLEIHAIDAPSGRRTPVKIASAEATFEQGVHKVTNAFDDNPKSGWAVHEGRKLDREHTAVFRFSQPVEAGPNTTFEIVLRHDSVHKNHNLGRFRLSLTDAKKPAMTTEQDALIAAINTPTEKRSDDQRKKIAAAHRQSDPAYKQVATLRDGLVKQRANVEKSVPKVMVMSNMAKPRQTFILERGLYNKPTDPVSAALPGFLPAGRTRSEATWNRLTLADWLVDQQNPLPSRVTVNRFWQQVFGIGLVKTPEDFGRQGEIPIQMDLLNYLAANFRESGWNVKELMRTIVTSHTYRQSSKIRDAAEYQSDPGNRLLARGPRYRMPSWMLRDQALAASGLLSTVEGGPAVNTYQPPGIWEEASFGKKKYTRDHGEKLYRRSLYTFWRRIIAPTMFFDNASRQTCTVKPGRTNTPLHALQTLNNTAYVEAARALAQLALQTDAADDDSRIDFVINRLLARNANHAEQSILRRGLERSRREFGAVPAEAIKFVSVGESARDESLDAVEHASWTALCLAVLNFDETLTRE